MFKHFSKKIARKEKDGDYFSDDLDSSDDESVASDIESSAGSDDAAHTPAAPVPDTTLATVLTNPVYRTEHDILCAVCPGKQLKHGNMLEVHLASKGHKRRFERLTKFAKDECLPMDLEAEDVLDEIDRRVEARLVDEATYGGGGSASSRGAVSASVNATAEKSSASPRSKSAVLEQKLAQPMSNHKKRNKEWTLAQQAKKDAKRAARDAKRKLKQEAGDLETSTPAKKPKSESSKSMDSTATLPKKQKTESGKESSAKKQNKASKK